MKDSTLNGGASENAFAYFSEDILFTKSICDKNMWR
jgi:hypothetical protein